MSVTDKDQSSGVSRTSANIGWMIGSTTATGDNSSTADANKSLIVTLASPNSGTAQNSVLSGVTTKVSGTGKAATMVEYTTTYTANTTWTGGTTVYAGVLQPRTDVVTAEDLVSAVSTTATNFSRVTWLG
tara:strand:- start:154 stop:543 length:390 start_codon:yes stop_codon:yes gene_type:complete